jgi:transaldolase
MVERTKSTDSIDYKNGLFLDTGKFEDIKKFYDMGVIQGVTTNPTILLKNGITGGLDGVKKESQKIAAYIGKYPLSVELTINDNKEQMIAQAKEFAQWAPNIVIKVPFHGPNGELDNLYVIHELEKVHKIPVNVTAMMSAQQCYLAAVAGATYVSLFCGRINDMGYDSAHEVSRLRKLLDMNGLESKIICASTREVLNITQWMEAGGHIVTVAPDILGKSMIHPYTKETVQMFMKDAKELLKELDASKNSGDKYNTIKSSSDVVSKGNNST